MDFSDLAKLASGHVEARIVHAAVQLGIFDAITEEGADPTMVAQSLGLEARATELMLNALAALNLLRKHEQRFFTTEVTARYLVSSSHEYLGGMIRFDASLWQCWERLTDAIRSGEPVRPANMYQDDSIETETFIGAMDSLVKARGDAEVLAKAFDWNKVTELLDVGSGPATYPISLCRKFPHLHASILDLPATLTVTERHVRAARLESRIKLISGDYRTDKIPGSYDAIFLSNIIHGEGADENRRLIANLFSVLKPGGSVIVKDHILDPSRTHPPVGAVFSLLMLLTTRSGRCYTFDEVRTWLELAGLRRVRQIDMPAPLNSSLIIGDKQLASEKIVVD